MNEVLAGCQALALRKIDWLLDMENKAPFTSNEHYLGDYRDKFLKSYREAEITEAVDLEDVDDDSPLLTLTPSYVDYTPSRHYVIEDAPVPRKSEPVPRDPYEPALHHMASARAYFQGSHLSLYQTPNAVFTIHPSRSQALHGYGPDDH